MRASLLRSAIPLMLLSLSTLLHAQPVLTVFDVNSSGFPKITAKMLALDATGKPLRGLRPEDISVVENGVPRKITAISCPPEKPVPPISIGFMVDTYRYIDLASAGIKRMAAFLQMPPAETGITTMDQGVYIVQDFTKKKDRLLDATTRLISSPGIHLQRIFYEPNSGGVPFISGRAPKKVLVLLTDLHCPIFDLDTTKFWKDAARENITVYSILFNANDYFGLFKRLGDKTGGKVFERVTTVEEIGKILEEIALEAQGLDDPCTIEWEGDLSCDTIRSATVSIPSQAITTTAQYNAPLDSLATLEIVPAGVRFINLPPGGTYDTTIVITARKRAITIYGISSNGQRFSLIGNARSFPITLQADESISLTLRYSPTDSSSTFQLFAIQSDACNRDTLYAAGMYSDRVRSQPTLKVLNPNGGETLFIGDTATLTWGGILPTDTVGIDYSIDAGVTWKPIAAGITGGKYVWPVPNTPSHRCLLRVWQREPIKLIDSTQPYGSSGAWSAEFSLDGERIVSRTPVYFGGRIIVWNISTGTYTILDGHRGTVYGAVFSPDGTMIATSCADSTIRIWTAQKDSMAGTLIRTFPVDYSHYWQTAFTPDSRAVVGKDGDNLCLWDVVTGKRIQTYSSIPFTPLVDISRDGSRIVTNDHGKGIVKMWYLATGEQVTSFVPTGRLAYPRFNSHGDRLVASEHLGDRVDMPVIIDATSGIRIRQLDDQSEFFFDGRYDPTDHYIITDGDIWDAQSGKLITQLGGHPSSSFSPDGYRIATCSNTKVYVWQWNSFQQDTSDSLWSIVAPQFSVGTPEIDMGQVLLHSSKDSIVKAVLCNRGTAPVHVLGVDVTSGSTEDFMIMSGAGDFTLAPGECRDIVFTFMPMALGLREARVTVRTTADTLSDTIHVFGVGVEPVLQVIGAPIDCGVIEVGDRKDTTVQVVLKNTGSVPITFNNASQIGPDMSQFTITSGGDPFTLASGEEHAVSLCFAPRFIGRTNGRIAFGYNGVGSPAIVSLFGQGVGGEAYVPDDSAAPGDRIVIPLMLGGAHRSLGQNGSTRFRAQLRFDASILTPFESAFRGPIENGYQTMTVDGTWDGASDTLAALPFIVGLGTVEETEIEMPSFSWLDDKGAPALLDVDTRDGTFRVTGLCHQGGTRLVDATGTVALKPARPSPTSDAAEIEYETIESGRTRLYLVDMLGRIVATIVDGDVDRGRYAAQLDASQLPTGLYYCVLQTPTIRLTQEMRVVK